MLSLVAAPVTTVAVARALNAVGDASVHAERVTVLDKGTVDNRRGRDIHWLEVSPWGEHTRPVRLDIEPDLHDKIAKGDALVLRIGRGRLGFEWMSDIAPTRPAPTSAP